ncbi:MAG: alpha/beta fold hydrolase [Actinobacteria bacterium]|nr:alpha/beta fold hydrolase [Actinomycetota bacterium]
MTTVLIHPVGLDRHCWDWVSLTGAVAHDLPAHGGRPRPGDLTMAAFADDVVSSYEGPLHLVGLSMGGMVALQAALRHVRRVRSLVVACSNAAAVREVMLERAEAVEVGGMEPVLESTLERWFTPEALAGGHPGVEYARRRLLADDPADFAACWRAMAGHNVADRLGEIRVHVTAIAGDADRSSPVAALERIASGVERGRLRVLKGPHMLQLEEPAAFTAAVEEHLAWVEAMGEAGN